MLNNIAYINYKKNKHREIKNMASMEDSSSSESEISTPNRKRSLSDDEHSSQTKETFICCCKKARKDCLLKSIKVEDCCCHQKICSNPIHPDQSSNQEISLVQRMRTDFYLEKQVLEQNITNALTELIKHEAERCTILQTENESLNYEMRNESYGRIRQMLHMAHALKLPYLPYHQQPDEGYWDEYAQIPIGMNIPDTVDPKNYAFYYWEKLQTELAPNDFVNEA